MTEAKFQVTATINSFDGVSGWEDEEEVEGNNLTEIFNMLARDYPQYTSMVFAFSRPKEISP